MDYLQTARTDSQSELALFFAQAKRYLRGLRVGKKHLLYLAGGSSAFLVLVPVLTYAYFARDLQSREAIMNRNETGVILEDRHGEIFFSFFEAKQKTFVPLSEIPLHTQQAVVAMEDKEFYVHSGFSLRGIARAAWVNLKSLSIKQGGSTITQQLVKNALLNPRRSFLRKYQEFVLALEIDRRFTKDEILEMYLNSVYFGEGAFGAEAAAQTYFGKPAKSLSLSESTYLVALLRAPTALSPFNGGGEKADERQKLVLQEMVSQGFIRQDAAEKALAQKLAFKPREDQDTNRIAPHFALMVLRELEKEYGEEEITRSGFTVKTTLELEWQKYAESVLAREVARLGRKSVSNGAAVAIDPKNGEVRVLVGSKDWFNEEFGKFNVATASRQPGSAFKPIVYARALEERRITPATTLHDRPTTFAGGYEPRNYDDRFRGDVLARRALANSINVPSVEVMNKVGVRNALDLAQKLGITTLENPENYGLSLVLGGGEVKLLELTSAYSVFANKGVFNDPTLILEIEDKFGKTIFEHGPKPKRAVSEEIAFLISSILADSAARAEIFGSALNISRPAAVKTGTTQDFRDAWTVGYTPSLTVGVWVGNNDNSPMDRVAGSLGAAPIWRSLMERFLQGTRAERFTPPDGVYSTWICADNGLAWKGETNQGKQDAQNQDQNQEAPPTPSIRTEYFLDGTGPAGVCTPTSTPSPSPEPEEDEKDKPYPSPSPENQPPGQEKKEEEENSIEIQIGI